MSARSLRRLGLPLQVGGLLAFVVALALTFTYGAGRSAAAGVTVTVTKPNGDPPNGLHDGDTVRVQASGLPPNHANVQSIQCVQGATDSSQCDGNTEDTSTDSDSSGNYDNQAFVVHTLSTANFDSINCDSTHPCEIWVGVDFNNAFASNSGTANISFSDSAPTTTSTSTTVPTGTTTTTQPTATTTTSIDTGTTTTTTGGSTTTTQDPNATTTTTATAGGSTDSGSSTGSGTGSDVSGSSSPAGGSGSTLPLTSAPPLAPWFAAFGVLAFASGTAVRRSALRAAARTA